jgi:anti-sigma B factor antagonist
MQLSVFIDRSVIVVAVGYGRVDARVAADFARALAEIPNVASSRVVLDLSATNFIDSSGLGAIVGLRRAVGRDGQVLIAGAQAPVRTLFKLTRLDRVFHMYDTATSAIEVANGGQQAVAI